MSFQGVIHIAETGIVSLNEKDEWGSEQAQQGDKTEEKQCGSQGQFTENIAQGDEESAEQVAEHATDAEGGLAGAIPLEMAGYFFGEWRHKRSAEGDDELFEDDEAGKNEDQKAGDMAYGFRYGERNGIADIISEAPGAAEDSRGYDYADDCGREEVSP